MESTLQRKEYAMIVMQTPVGNIFSCTLEHIVFPVRTDGTCDPNGSASMMFRRWPKLPRDRVIGNDFIEEDGRRFYPLPCYSRSDNNGWEKTPTILEQFLVEKLPVQYVTPVGVIVPGCSDMEVSWGANPHANLQAVQRAAERRDIVVYTDFPLEQD